MKPANMLMTFLAMGTVLVVPGCVRKQEREVQAVFKAHSLDACLAISIDLSGSFSVEFGERAYPLVLELVESFSTQHLGGECRIVLSQMSGHENVLLFEGTPGELRRKFGSPDEMARYMKEQAKPGGSPVYTATRKTIDHINAMTGVTDETQILTVIMSDLRETEPDAKQRSSEGYAMIESLKTYREGGGMLALYFVAPEEVTRWRKVVDMAGFEGGRVVISPRFVAHPQLPSFH